jgi:hypothetical protein
VPAATLMSDAEETWHLRISHVSASLKAMVLKTRPKMTVTRIPSEAELVLMEAELRSGITVFNAETDISELEVESMTWTLGTINAFAPLEYLLGSSAGMRLFAQHFVVLVNHLKELAQSSTYPLTNAKLLSLPLAPLFPTALVEPLTFESDAWTCPRPALLITTAHDTIRCYVAA